MIENPTLPTEFLHASVARKYREKPKTAPVLQGAQESFQGTWKKNKASLRGA